MSNWAPWRGHSTMSSSTNPSESEASSCEQVSPIAKKPAGRWNTAIGLPPTTHRRASFNGISSPRATCTSVASPTASVLQLELALDGTLERLADLADTYPIEDLLEEA